MARIRSRALVLLVALSGVAALLAAPARAQVGVATVSGEGVNIVSPTNRSQLPAAGSGTVRRAVSVFSWEPGIDASTADRCELLGQDRCLLPFPSDRFTVADPSTDTGRRVDFNVASMPANTAGVHIDPTEWNRSDGFSPGAMIIAHVP